MLKHRNILLVAALGILLAGALVAARRTPADGTTLAVELSSPAVDKRSTGEVRRLPSQAAPGEAELLDDIRQQIGSPLDRFMFGVSAGDAEAGTGATGETVPFREFVAQEAKRGRQFHDGPHASYRPPAADVDPANRYAAALRDAARALDIAAADLEDAQAYDLADRLRQRASALRHEARQLPDDGAID